MPVGIVKVQCTQALSRDVAGDAASPPPETSAHWFVIASRRLRYSTWNMIFHAHLGGYAVSTSCSMFGFLRTSQTMFKYSSIFYRLRAVQTAKFSLSPKVQEPLGDRNMVMTPCYETTPSFCKFREKLLPIKQVAQHISECLRIG